MIQSVQYINPYMQNRQNPDIIAAQIKSRMSNSIEDIHKLYYPDLTDDEFYIEPKNKNELLFKRGKFLQLAKYGTPVNCEMTYNKIKDNPNFKELAASKYLNSAQGFVRLVSSMNSLELQRSQRMVSPYIQGANVSYVYPIPYGKYNLNDYLRLLNDFTKNPKISDDLKQYFLAMKADKIDVYYTRLDKLENSADPLKTLTENIPYSKE